ncbi:YncE family protein [Marinobacter gelidimuriae]|uniref:YncE family protein n=1 Tax=Marinobacter gelidimuriae TaxID=2739064 RepID=UPI0009D9503E|nr:YncE family protein [Marinobacter gelidimuriae]
MRAPIQSYRQCARGAPRTPHEGFISPDGKTAWVAVCGENAVEIFDIDSGKRVNRVVTAKGVSKVVFSPDGQRAYVNHLFTNELVVIDTKTQTITNRIAIPKQAGGSADLAVTPDGKEVWLGQPITGHTTVIDTDKLDVKTVLETGPRTNHPNFVTLDGVNYAYVTVGGENVTKVFRRPQDGSNPVQVDTIKNSGVGPHGIWPSPDNTQVYVVLQKSDALDVIDTATRKVIKTLPD